MIDLEIGPLLENEIQAADRVFRLAFGTRNGLPDPTKFDGDAGRMRSRFYSPAVTALAGRVKGELVASALATRWGSFTWLGPLSVHPDLWNAGIAQRLFDQLIPSLDRYSRHLALYTVAESTKHVGLYQRYGFWPGFLTIVMEKRISPGGIEGAYQALSSLQEEDRTGFLDQCRTITSALYPGLDVTLEITSAETQHLGETLVTLSDDGVLTGIAICHTGAGTEAGSDTTYVKFAAVQGGDGASETFARLLSACDGFAAARGSRRILAGVNTGRRAAYAAMLRHGYRSILQGVAMHRPDDMAYDRPDAFAIDDWR